MSPFVALADVPIGCTAVAGVRRELVATRLIGSVVVPGQPAAVRMAVVALVAAMEALVTPLVAPMMAPVVPPIAGRRGPVVVVRVAWSIT